jgi:hypothetical protein
MMSTTGRPMRNRTATSVTDHLGRFSTGNSVLMTWKTAQPLTT